MILTILVATTSMMMSTFNSNKELIVVVGPTASGKSDLAIDIATKFQTEIISTDSRQFFRQMSIGTAAPTADQLAHIKHHLIHSRNVWEDYAAGQFEIEALDVLDKIFVSHSKAVAVGGSGLYIDALCQGFDEVPTVDNTIREELNELFELEGLERLLEELKEVDYSFYQSVDRANHKRIIRALEVYRSTGTPYSSLRKGKKSSRPFKIRKIGIDLPRPILYDRINRRVDIMIEQGLENEARSVYEYRNYNALRTVGYSEMFDYFDGKISKDDAIDKIKQNSRRYAKRQMTWFRRDSEIVWIDSTDKINSIL